jgi:acetyl esterase/lipase
MKYMKYLIVLSTFLLFGQTLKAQEMIELWGDDPIGKTLEKKEPRSVPDHRITRLHDVSNPRMEVFKPAGNDNGNVVIVCPGGGYSILAYDLEGTEIAEWLNTLGYTAYVLQYRVPGQREGAFQDVQRAMGMVRSMHGENAQIGVLGFSAGGHLAASAGTRYNELAYEAMDDADGLSKRPDFVVLIYPAYLDKGENETLSPEITLDEETPPFFIFMTADDNHAGSSIAMAGALRKNKTSVEFHLLPEGGHGYGMRDEKEAGLAWPIFLEKWLAKIH